MEKIHQIIESYEQDHGKVFDFVIDDDAHIRIQRYYDDPSREHIDIPDFVYGFILAPLAQRLDWQEPIFKDIKYLKSIGLGAGVQDLSYMFFKASFLSCGLDLSDWDTSRVFAMAGLFNEARFKSLTGLEHWDVSHVITMRSMFSEFKVMEDVDLGRWDVSQVDDFCCMFAYSELCGVGDLSKWNVSRAQRFDGMFRGARRISGVGDISGWDVSNAEDLSWMFACSGLLDDDDFENELSSWPIDSVGQECECMFYNGFIDEEDEDL